MGYLHSPVGESAFSDDRNGEGEFDAVIGLLAMIAVVTGAIDTSVPADDPAVISTERWILGRSADGPARRPGNPVNRNTAHSHIAA